MSKVGRNDPCPCGSGKKFKKCCEDKAKHKKFSAQVLRPDDATKTSSLFFKRNITPLTKSAPPSPEAPKNPVM